MILMTVDAFHSIISNHLIKYLSGSPSLLSHAHEPCLLSELLRELPKENPLRCLLLRDILGQPLSPISSSLSQTSN